MHIQVIVSRLFLDSIQIFYGCLKNIQSSLSPLLSATPTPTLTFGNSNSSWLRWLHTESTNNGYHCCVTCWTEVVLQAMATQLEQPNYTNSVTVCQHTCRKLTNNIHRTHLWSPPFHLLRWPSELETSRKLWTKNVHSQHPKTFRKEFTKDVLSSMTEVKLWHYKTR